jgi:uncharacterized protein
MLKIPVDQLREEPGSYDLDVRPQEIDLTDSVFTFEGRVQGRLEFKLVGHDVEGRGELTAQVTTPCVRCLEPASFEMRVPFHEVWFRREPVVDPEDVPFGQEEPADFTYSGDTLYPAEAFREVIMAELPERPLCRPDCKGLCPGCGANLNHEACRCARSDSEQPTDAGPSAGAEPDWKRALRELKDRT